MLVSGESGVALAGVDVAEGDGVDEEVLGEVLVLAPA
jgi:hypothetical protein